MANVLKIDGVVTKFEQNIDWGNDGTEEFDFARIKIVNSTRREVYPDYADIELTINGVTFVGCISQDVSTRQDEGTYWTHSISIAELVLKLKQYICADRKVDTVNGVQATYLQHYDRIMAGAFIGKTNPYTLLTPERLDITGVDYEYSGSDLLTNLTDLFRSIKAIPTLSLSNEIGFTDIGGTGDLISLDTLSKIGEVIDSSIADYALSVHTKAKNATYDGAVDTDSAWFPAPLNGIYPRSSTTIFDDADAEFILDSGVRRYKIANVRNLPLNRAGFPTIIADITRWILPKEQWDNLEIETDTAILVTGLYKNNTLWYNEGSNLVQNLGVKYKNSEALITGDTTYEWLVKTYLTYTPGYDISDYFPQTIRRIEMNFLYQAQRDVDVRTERHDLTRVNKKSTILNNQKSSVVEIRRHGIANKGLVNRLGNDQFSVTVRYTDFTPYSLFKIGDYTEDNYKIIKIQILARDNSTDVTYLFTKNYSILNPITRVESSLSPFTINKRNILTCFTFDEYIEFGGTQRTNTGSLTADGIRSLINGLDYNATYNKPIYGAQYRSNAIGLSNALNLSVMKFPHGTSLVFNAQFQEPKVAGYQLVADGVLADKLNPIAYTDEAGEVEYFFMSFHNNLIPDRELHPVGSVQTDYIISPSRTYNALLSPNEILGLSFHLHLITDRENFIIGNYLAENNSLMRELTSQNAELRVYDPDVFHTIYDDEAKAGYTLGSISVQPDTILIIGAFNKSWVICNSEGKIYFAFNSGGLTLSLIYINSLKERTNTVTL